MALLTFLISLLLALLALRGWPVESGVWTQALLAMGFLAIGTAAMVFSASSPVSKRLVGLRKRRWLDRVVGGLCITLIAGLLYGILVFAPPASSELRFQVVTVIQERFGWGVEDQEPVDADEPDLDPGYEMEVGGLFDPNGAIVPKSADLSPSPEPAVSLKMADRAGGSPTAVIPSSVLPMLPAALRNFQTAASPMPLSMLLKP